MRSHTVPLYDAGGPRARLRSRVLSVVFGVVFAALAAWVISSLSAQGQLDAAKWTPFLSVDVWTTYLLPGLWGTITAAITAIVLATLLGIVLGVGRMSQHRAVRLACGALVEMFRATPMLVLMIFLFQVYANYGLVASDALAFATVVTALTLGNGAVIAEIVRAGVQAVPRGQAEAAAALGLQPGQTMRMILLPQAITAMLPPLVAQMVIALKDTALGYQITYLELVRQGVQAGSAFSNYLPSLIVVAVVMIVINYALGRLATRIEKRLRAGRRSAAVVHDPDGGVVVPISRSR